MASPGRTSFMIERFETADPGPLITLRPGVPICAQRYVGDRYKRAGIENLTHEFVAAAVIHPKVFVRDPRLKLRVLQPLLSGAVEGDIGSHDDAQWCAALDEVDSRRAPSSEHVLRKTILEFQARTPEPRNR